MKFLGKVLRGTTDQEIVYTEEQIGVIGVRKYMPYRGVTQRPPSEAVRKLHPLMQLDEQIGRDMTKGDQEGPSECTSEHSLKQFSAICR